MSDVPFPVLSGRRRRRFNPPQTNLIDWWTAGVGCHSNYLGNQPSHGGDDVMVWNNRISGRSPIWYPVDAYGTATFGGSPPLLLNNRVVFQSGYPSIAFAKNTMSGISNSIGDILANSGAALTVYIHAVNANGPLLSQGCFSYFDGSSYTQDWLVPGCTPAFSMGIYASDNNGTDVIVNFDQPGLVVQSSSFPNVPISSAVRQIGARVSSSLTGGIINPRNTSQEDSFGLIDYQNYQPSPAGYDYGICTTLDESGSLAVLGDAEISEILIYNAYHSPSDAAQVFKSWKSRF